MIVAATGQADVAAAVRFAAIHGLPVGVRTTGHCLPAARSGGMLITTGRMTGVRVDVAARTVWLAAGVRWQQVVHEAAAHGLAPLSGSSPDVGAVSYTLGGGLGLLSRRYGYAADHVKSIDVVTAEGTCRNVTTTSDPDLFWALRGGRDNFGVVTGLEVDLFPVTGVYGGGLFFDANNATAVLRAWRDWTATVPDDMASSVAIIAFPDLPAVPDPLRGRHIVHVRIVHSGGTATGVRIVAPLRAITPPPLLDTLDEMPYTASGSIYNDPTSPLAYDADNAMLNTLDDGAIDTIVEQARSAAEVPCVVQLRHLGGALTRPPTVTNAVGHRDAIYLFSVLSNLDGHDPGAVRAAHALLINALGPSSVGRNLNYLYGANTTPEQVRSAYDSDDYLRLAQLKADHDPTNLFRLNHNIPPATPHDPAGSLSLMPSTKPGNGQIDPTAAGSTRTPTS